MRYKANGGSLEDDTGKQILVMLPANCSKKRLREIVKLTANMLNNIECGKEAAALWKQRQELRRDSGQSD
jgi:hypothetical protein